MKQLYNEYLRYRAMGYSAATAARYARENIARENAYYAQRPSRA